LTLGLQQPLLERAHPLGGVLEPPPKGEHLFFERSHLVRIGALLGPGHAGPAFLVVLVDRDHLLGRSRSDPTPEIAGRRIRFRRRCRAAGEFLPGLPRLSVAWLVLSLSHLARSELRT
jgi:hypothetical protein